MIEPDNYRDAGQEWLMSIRDVKAGRPGTGYSIEPETNVMKHFRADIELKNAINDSLLPITVTALVDTGLLHLCIPEHIAIELGFDFSAAEQREMTVATGERKLYPYVGPIQITFYKNRKCFSGAVVMGDEVLLGAMHIADMNLIVRL